MTEREETVQILMDKYRSPVWIDKDGNLVPLAIMSERYRKNIINFLTRQRNQASLLLIMGDNDEEDDFGPWPLDAEDAASLFMPIGVDLSKVRAVWFYADSWLKIIDAYEKGTWRLPGESWLSGVLARLQAAADRFIEALGG